LTLAGAQPLPGEDVPQAEQAETRVDFSTQQRGAPRHRWPPRVTWHGGDGYYAKQKYIEAVVTLDLHASTKRRSDADDVCLSTGPPPKRRGARRQYAGKVTGQDLSRFEDLGPMEEAPHRHLYTAVVGHKTLQRHWRMVVLLNRKDPATPRCMVLGSPDPELHGRTLVARYAARFQIALLCRAST
jgi:hypothetical protein